MQVAIQEDIYAKSRESMVQSQLHPSGIVNEDVLEAYRSVPRDLFVPAERKGVCYQDAALEMPNGRFLLEPLVHGLMVENLALQKTDVVLDIGGLTGYSAVVLSRLAGHVCAIDQDDGAVAFARDIMPALGIYNVDISTGQHAGGWARGDGYDAILINGAVAEQPNSLIAELKTGGRLACVLKPQGRSVGKIVIYRKEPSGVVSELTLLDAWSAYLPGFEPKPVFAF